MYRFTSKERKLVLYDLYLDIGSITFFDKQFLSNYEIIQFTIVTVDHTFQWKSKLIQLLQNEDINGDVSSSRQKIHKKNILSFIIPKQKAPLQVQLNKNIKLCVQKTKIPNIIIKVKGYSTQNSKSLITVPLKNAKKKSIRDNIICQCILTNEDILAQANNFLKSDKKRNFLSKDDNQIAELQYSYILRQSLKLSDFKVPSLSLTPKQIPYEIKQNEHTFTIQIKQTTPKCDFWSIFKKNQKKTP